MLDSIRRLTAPYPALFRALRSVFRAGKSAYRPWRRLQERRLIRRFHRLFYDGPFEEHGRWWLTRWWGVPVQKCPLDLFVYQELLHRTRPEVIVETGVNFGGSTLYLAHLCDLLDCGTVVACDLTLENVDPVVRAHPRVELLQGDSTSEETLAAVRARCTGRRTMVVLDSDHQKEHVLKELRLYAPLVSPGCYLICEDTNINGHPAFPSFGPGPYEALQTFLSETGGWTIDRECEKLLVTFNPSGYLRRNVPPETETADPQRA